MHFQHSSVLLDLSAGAGITDSFDRRGLNRRGEAYDRIYDTIPLFVSTVCEKSLTVPITRWRVRPVHGFHDVVAPGTIVASRAGCLTCFLTSKVDEKWQ